MRLNVYGFLQFFRDFSNCFFSSLFVKNMPKHATRVKGVPGAFVREIRPINCDQPRLDRGPRCAEPGPGRAVRARIARAAGIGSQSRHQAPGTRHQGSCQACQGSRTRDRARHQGSRNPAQAQGSRTRDRGTRPRRLGSSRRARDRGPGPGPGPGIADPGPGIGYQGSRYAVRFQGF